MPTTRSNAKASSSKAQLDDRVVDRSVDSEETKALDLDLETHVNAVVKGIDTYRRTIHTLKRKNSKLQAELDALHEAEDVSIQPRKGKSAGPTVGDLQTQVKKLKRENKKLEEARELDRKKLRKYRMKEVKADAEELGDELFHGVADTSHHMLKMLRSFQDTMAKVCLEEDQKCAICMEKMILGESQSLPCEHIFCTACLVQYQPGSPDLPCPGCRKQCKREDFEVVDMTATQQWDHLLSLAKDFGVMDTTRGAEETSDEEAEEEFIDDDQPDDSSAMSAVPEGGPARLESEGEPAVNEELPPAAPAEQADDIPAPDAPESSTTASQARPLSASYSQSSSALKRQKMEELAAERLRKKRR